MARLQIDIEDIKDVYESGKVIFNLLDGPKEFSLKAEEIEIIRDYFRGKYILPNYHADLLLEQDRNGDYFFIKVVGDMVLSGWRISFVEGVLLEWAHETKIFQERRD